MDDPKEQDKKSTLAGTSLFEGVSREQLLEFARVVTEKTLSPGTMIFEQGDPGDSFYIIRSGKVKVFRRGDQGIETQLSVLGPGDSFGEMALLTGKPRSACIRALDETEVTVLPKEEFDRILQGHPDVSLAFVKQMSEWLLRDEARLQTATERALQPPRFTWLDIAFIAAVVVLCGLIFNTANPNGLQWIPKTYAHDSVTFVSPEEGKAALDQGAVMVDARPSNFFDEEHIKGAVNLPLPVFDFVYMMQFGSMDKEKPIIVYGRNISRHYDSEVAYRLVLRGHRNVSIMKKGLSGWEKQQYPVAAQEDS